MTLRFAGLGLRQSILEFLIDLLEFSPPFHHAFTSTTCSKLSDYISLFRREVIH